MPKRYFAMDLKELMKKTKVVTCKDDFHVWKNSIAVLGYSAEWSKELLDTNGDDSTWDGHESIGNSKEKELTKQRREAFMILHSSVGPELQHLIENVKLGDANKIWRIMHGWYMRRTPAGYQQASMEFHGCRQSESGLGLEQFINLVTRNCKSFESVGGKPQEIDKVTVLLTGVLPVFQAIVTVIQGADPTTLKYEKVSDRLIDWAKQFGHLEAGAGSKEVFMMANGGPKGAQECRQWKKAGVCSFGSRCKFAHDDKPGRPRSSAPKEKDVPVAGSCGYCGNAGHEKSRCFKMKKDLEEAKAKVSLLTMDMEDGYHMNMNMMVLVEPTSLSLVVGSPGEEGKAVFDSGTVRHIGNHASQFERGSLVKSDARVKVADGKIVQVLLEGVHPTVTWFEHPLHKRATGRKLPSGPDQ